MVGRKIMSRAKIITAGEFLKCDTSRALILDVREPDEALLFPLENSLNVPFSALAERADSIPRERPVFVLCDTGLRSEEVAEILADRDYDVTNVLGGTRAVQAALSINETHDTPPDEHESRASQAEVPAALVIDLKGLKCPGPIVKLADALRPLDPGTRVTVEATEEAFLSDVAVWCARTGNHLINLNTVHDVIRAEIVKGTKNSVQSSSLSAHAKTFVVFSGELDKAVAAFIMANGAAAMGREVTLFFTFWGLNILRNPEPVKIHKKFLARLFGWAMPRGSQRLGLSRMNMGGLGAKIIRRMMKSNGVSSLEEMMREAMAHGVRLVACQMSMELMGICREELIEGVELGGVATMLGAAELSDLTYFI